MRTLHVGPLTSDIFPHSRRIVMLIDRNFGRFRYPDPFVPLHSKLELFEANDIGHVLSQKKVVLREEIFEDELST
eukprot:SAG31_NODE_393_length_16293_cov_15.804372_13_plen_75_part_00